MQPSGLTESVITLGLFGSNWIKYRCHRHHCPTYRRREHGAGAGCHRAGYPDFTGHFVANCHCWFSFAGDILRVMGADPKVIETGTIFARIQFLSAPVVILLYSLSGALRGAGAAATAMRSLIVANCLNMILGPMLIFGFGPLFLNWVLQARQLPRLWDVPSALVISYIH